MSTNDGLVSGTALTETLQIALAQCQDQVQALAGQSEVVDRLRRENEQLRQELETLRTSSTQDIEKKYQAQFQNLFQQNATKQAEIDQLKGKLQNVREKARRRGLVDPITSSPALPLSGVSFQSVQQPLGTSSPSERTQAGTDKTLADRSQTPDPKPKQLIKTSKKRMRSLSPPARLPLQDISVNIDHTGKHIKAKRYRLSDRGVAAIPSLAEDGEDHLQAQTKKNIERKSKPLRESIYHRLDNLLDNHDPTSPSLHNTKGSVLDNANNGKEVTSPSEPTTPSFGLLTSTTSNKPRRPRSSIGISKRPASPSPEDEEPFRSRPLHRQTLSHFKLNPATNSGLDYAYNEVTRGHSRQLHPGCTKPCCRAALSALATTTPLSDNELLLRFLGAGSEDRVRTLTAKARENLLHEARIKFAADTYGKMHRDAHERPRSPPGFWSTDWPRSQEERENREMARKLEREEVERRYNDALKGGGKWIFADE